MAREMRQSGPMPGHLPRCIACLSLVVAITPGVATQASAQTAPTAPPAGAGIVESPAGAPTPGAGPVEPLPGAAPAPFAATVPAPSVYSATDAPPVGVAAASERAPFYRRWWFWTAVGAFAVTAVVIIATSSGPSAPKTDFGNMPAF